MICCAACADCVGSRTMPPPNCACAGMVRTNAADSTVRINPFMVILLVGLYCCWGAVRGTIVGTPCSLALRRKNLLCQVIALGVQFLAMGAVLTGFCFALMLVDRCLLLWRRTAAQCSADNGVCILVGRACGALLLILSICRLEIG